MAIKFDVVLPEPPANPDDWDEIAFGKLAVTIPGKPVMEFTVEKSAQQTVDRRFADENFAGPQNTFVQLNFAYVDDAGNEGTPVVAMIELLDTVPPVAPTEIGLVATGEIPD